MTSPLHEWNDTSDKYHKSCCDDDSCSVTVAEGDVEAFKDDRVKHDFEHEVDLDPCPETVNCDIGKRITICLPCNAFCATSLEEVTNQSKSLVRDQVRMLNGFLSHIQAS
jgi:hypothetical protein